MNSVNRYSFAKVYKREISVALNHRKNLMPLRKRFTSAGMADAIQAVSNDFSLRLYLLACMFSFVNDFDSRCLKTFSSIYHNTKWSSWQLR